MEINNISQNNNEINTNILNNQESSQTVSKYNLNLILLYKHSSKIQNNEEISHINEIVPFSYNQNSAKSQPINKKIIISQFDLVDNFMIKKRNIFNNSKIIDSMLNIILGRVKKEIFNIIKNISKLNYLKNIYNKINNKTLKKEFFANLKDKSKSNFDNSIAMIKITVNLKKYVKNNDGLLERYFGKWINITNKKNILNLLIKALLLKKNNKENSINKYKKYINKKEVLPNSKTSNIHIPKNISKKRRIVKRNNFKKKNKKKNEIIKIKKEINDKEILRGIIHRWKNNAQNIKVNEDYKNILNSIKKQNKDEQQAINKDKNENKIYIKKNKKESINNDLLNKLKKVSLHLLLSKYQKVRDLLLKKFFNSWKSYTLKNKMKKKNKKLIKQITKYIKKKVGSCFKQKKIVPSNVNNANNENYLKKNKEKTFAKKKTKLNLYKEKINHYKNFFQNNFINNNNNIDYDSSEKIIINPENYIISENTPETNKINTNNFIINKISNFTEPKYIIKKPGRRNLSQERIYYRNNNEDDYCNTNNINEKKRPYISKSTEKLYKPYKGNNDLGYFNSYMDNLLTNTEYSSDYPYNRLTDSRDKASNLNLLKTLSSQEEATSNHISLLQAKNEIRNPKNSINISIKNKKNYFSPDKTYKIMNPKKILTEKKPQKNLNEERNNNEYLLPYAYENFINNKKYNKAFSSINSPFRKNELKQKNNNIYFCQNENENKAYKKYVNKPQYTYNMHYKEPVNYKNNSLKVNPLYERMRQNKLHNNYNNCYSPFSRKIIQDNNKIKVIYNRVNEIISTENDDYNDISKYGDETVENNYNDRNMFY